MTVVQQRDRGDKDYFGDRGFEAVILTGEKVGNWYAFFSDS